jgi:uncharacterized membrane protein
MDRPRDATYTRLLYALALTCALGWLFKAHCTGGGWSGLEQYTTGCYTDAMPFWDGRGVSAGEIPYFQARLEYPVLTGALIWIEGTVSRLLFGARANAWAFLLMVTLANALLSWLVLRLFWRAGMDVRRLWAWVLAPPLVLYLGHNWDMLAVTFAVAAVLLAREGRMVQSGAMAGLGFAAKLYPVLLVPLLGLQALFAGTADWRKRLTGGIAIGAAAAGAWLLVNLPVAAFAFENWIEFFRFSSERPGTVASVWELAGYLFGWGTTIGQRNLYAALLFVVGAAAITGFGWRLHSERLWVLFTPVLAWFMLTNKVWSPQFDLWLYPMLLMTAPRLRPVAIFVVGDIAAYFAEFWWFAGMEGGWPSATPYDIAFVAAIRGAAMLWLIVDAVRLPPPTWLVANVEAVPKAQPV